MRDLLEQHYHFRNNFEDFSTPDPLIVLNKFRGHVNFDCIALVCALFAYGRADQIVKFLQSLDFDLLQATSKEIRTRAFPYYRFQTSQDVCELFCILSDMARYQELKPLVLEAYDQNGILGSINACIQRLHRVKNPSRGLNFLLSTPIKSINHPSALKRWNLFFRWLVRKDNIDFGIWHEIKTSDLILPLDTHTFKISKKLGLLQRNVCDLKSALLITEELKKFDCIDPVKYDFALYRIGQEKLLL